MFLWWAKVSLPGAQDVFCLSGKIAGAGAIALQWLETVGAGLGVVIRTASDPGGGHRIKVAGKYYRDDGYSEDGGVRHVFEFQGDWWHGTPCCFPDREKIHLFAMVPK